MPDARPDRGPLVHPLGLLIAATFFAASLTPSLMPREAALQGVLGGLLAGIGYEIGVLMGWLWRFLQLPRVEQPWRGRLGLVGYVLALGLAAWGLGRAAEWQNATRRVFGLQSVDTGHPLTIAALAFAVFAALWILFRLFGVMRRTIGVQTRRVLPPRLGKALAFALALWLVWALADGFLIRRAFEAADRSFEAADRFVSPDIPRPDEPSRTGSEASLVDWEEMGRWGRSFVATAPTATEIAAFAPGAMDPVRVYVGRRAAETAEERAAIALAELIRQGGFERSALVVVVPVGTGWMDPGGHDTLDFMLGGDVATVAVQYSYLTSVLSLFAHPEYGVGQSRALFDAVYDHWVALPEAERPALYVHGLSQGAFNSQMTLPLLDMLADPIDGAMWAGSPFFSPYWRFVRENRLADSPAWRPRFGNGSLARTLNQFGGLDGEFAPWGPVRLVFLNYGSDAIVVFNPASAWQPPDWMASPRAPDVAPELRWFPVVTTFQLALDMAVSLAVPGFGHFYIARDYIDAWAATVDPPDWTPGRAAELKAIFEARQPPF